MNKQPFYHRVVLLFTATRDISPAELTQLLREKLTIVPKQLRGTIEVEECDSEPGDPSDLM